MSEGRVLPCRSLAGNAAQRDEPQQETLILKITRVAILALFVCAAPRVAAAQTMQWTDKGYVSVNVGVQAGSHDLSESGSFPLYEETATFSSTAKVKGGFMFDLGGAYKVWGNNLLVGVTYSHVSSKSDGSLTGSVPDPVFTDRLRPVSADFTGLEHSENAVHLDAVWMIPVANKLDVGILAGPTIFAVKQDVVPSLTVAEPGPSVTTTVESTSKTTVGFNVGVDVQYMLRKKWGVGGMARYSVGSVSLPGASEKLTVGGFQIGVGARLRF
jgi:opacity protein-like surface antigen